MGKITAQELASILFEEFEKEMWGDISPHLFKTAAKFVFDDEDKEDEDFDDAVSLQLVLKRVANRINHL